LQHFSSPKEDKENGYMSILILFMLNNYPNKTNKGMPYDMSRHQNIERKKIKQHEENRSRHSQ